MGNVSRGAVRCKQCCQRSPAIQAAATHPFDSSIPNALQAGRLPEAEAIYRQILQLAPNHPDALHLLGLIASQAGKSETAVGLINRSISANPFDPFFATTSGMRSRIKASWTRLGRPSFPDGACPWPGRVENERELHF